MQRPGADAAHQEGVPELVLAGDRVADVAERPVEGQDARWTRRRPPCAPSCSARGPAAPWRAVRRAARDADPRAPDSPDGRRPRAWSSCAARRRGRPGRGSCPACAARRAAISSTLATPSAVSRMACTSSGFVSPCFASSCASSWSTKWMSQGPSTFGIITTSSLWPALADHAQHVVEEPRAVERVDARPELGRAEVHLVRDLHQPFARRDLVLDLDRVLEVREQDVHLLRDVRDLRRHARVRRIEEVDHARRAHRDVVPGLRRADRERRWIR